MLKRIGTTLTQQRGARDTWQKERTKHGKPMTCPTALLPKPRLTLESAKELRHKGKQQKIIQSNRNHLRYQMNSKESPVSMSCRVEPL